MSDIAQAVIIDNVETSNQNISVEIVDGKTIYNVKKLEDAASAGITYLILKRAMDVMCGFIGLIALIIPCLIISLIIVLDSNGSPLYVQERLGKHGKVFKLYKFRTMVVDAEKNGAQWAEEGDPRCTNVGRFLRATRLDELPQLINIFKGDMSLVGPRPERECFYEEFEKYIKGFKQRLYVTPGLTGLAQVNGGYDLKPEEKIVLDIDYIENRNLWLDIKIIFKTVGIVFSHKGAR